MEHDVICYQLMNDTSGYFFTTLGQVGSCPDWCLQVLQQRCSALQCSGLEKPLKDHLTIRLALHKVDSLP